MPLVIAHRGASGYRPEHSPAAYLLALEQGADGLEPDVVLSRDGVGVIRHDARLARSTDVSARLDLAHHQSDDEPARARLGPGSAGGTDWSTHDMDWATLSTLHCREPWPELRPRSASHDDTEGIIRLADLLTLIDSRSAAARLSREIESPAVVIELKPESDRPDLGLDPVRALGAELARAGWSASDARIVIESFSASMLARVPEDMRRVLLIDDADSFTAALGECAHSGFSGVSFSVERLAAMPGLVEEAHRAGLLVFVWTARVENAFLPARWRDGANPADWGRWPEWFDEIIASGVDGIFTDYPDLLRGRVEVARGASVADT